MARTRQPSRKGLPKPKLAKVAKSNPKKASDKKAVAAKPAKLLPPPAAGPGGPIEIVFSFDTTGSMYSCLGEVRGKIQEIIQRLTADIPAIRFAIIAHGDYCDRSNYITKWEDFSSDVPRLCKFVQEVGSTGGGDADECYELVLRQVHEEFSWTAGTQRALVMIGDCNPHEPNYPQNTRRINWRDEIKTLSGNGIRIYSVQCKDMAGSTPFYKALAEGTGGHYLNLNDFGNIFDFLMSICYREAGAEFFDAYEKEVRGRDNTLHRDMDQLFGTLRSDDIPDAPDSPSSSSSDSAARPTTERKTVKAVGARRTAKKPSGKKAPASAKRLKRKADEFDDSDSDDDTPVPKPVSAKPKATMKRAAARTLSPAMISFLFEDSDPDSDDDTAVPNLAKVAVCKPEKAARAEKRSKGVKTRAMKTKKKRDVVNDDDVLYSLAPHPREAARGKEFIMHDLAWSGWRVALVSPSDCRGQGSTWCPWQGVGVRRLSLFEGESHRPGLWEVGVQHASGKGRIIPVYFRVLPGFSDATRWDKSVLGETHLRECVDRALEGDYRVLVRRAPLTSAALRKHGAETLHDVKRWLYDVNDYAWLLRLPGGETRTCARDVITRVVTADDTGSAAETDDSAGSSSGESC